MSVSAPMEKGHIHLTPHVVASLYTEAMLLADEARAYFDMNWSEARLAGVTDPVIFSCQSLKVTTRLMHCIAWLLNQRNAAEAADSRAARRAAERPLGNSPPSDPAELHGMPDEARILITQSENLYKRLQRLNAKLERQRAMANATLFDEPPVRRMQALLKQSF